MGLDRRTVWAASADKVTPPCVRAVALTHKESILFMQRLAALERNGIADGPIKAQYEQVFLDMLYTMCTTPRPDAPEVRSLHTCSALIRLSVRCLQSKQRRQ